MPTKYADLGKKADDLINKNYEQGKYKVEVVAKTNKVEHTTKGHQSTSDGKITVSHEAKMQLCKLGELKTTFTPGADALACELANSHKALKGAKVTACFNMGMTGCPFTSSSLNKLKVAYGNDRVNFNADTTLGNTVNFDASINALPDQGIVFGIKSGINYKDFGITSKEFKVNIVQGSLDYTMTTALDNNYKCLFHNQINDKLSLATMISMGASGNGIEIAGKSAGCCGSTNQFKLNNNGRLALSHITPTSIGATLTMSAEFDATNFASGAHKVGAGVKFNF